MDIYIYFHCSQLVHCYVYCYENSFASSQFVHRCLYLLRKLFWRSQRDCTELYICSPFTICSPLFIFVAETVLILPARLYGLVNMFIVVCIDMETVLIQPVYMFTVHNLFTVVYIFVVKTVLMLPVRLYKLENMFTVHNLFTVVCTDTASVTVWTRKYVHHCLYWYGKCLILPVRLSRLVTMLTVPCSLLLFTRCSWLTAFYSISMFGNIERCDSNYYPFSAWFE